MFQSISTLDLAEAGAGAIQAGVMQAGATAGAGAIQVGVIRAGAGAIQAGAGVIQAMAGVIQAMVGVRAGVIIHLIMGITLMGNVMPTIRADSAREAFTMKEL